MNSETLSHYDIIRVAELTENLAETNHGHILIDVRTPIEFANAHIEHSENIPLAKLDPEALRERFPENPSLILICQSGKRAHKAQQKLKDSDFLHARFLVGGIDAWSENGQALLKLDNAPVSLERQVRIAAGFLILIGSFLTYYIHPLFFLLPAFMGGGLAFAGLTNSCGMAMLLARMPWNRQVTCPIS